MGVLVYLLLHCAHRYFLRWVSLANTALAKVQHYFTVHVLFPWICADVLVWILVEHIFQQPENGVRHRQYDTNRFVSGVHPTNQRGPKRGLK